jgi:hypothetical protein
MTDVQIRCECGSRDCGQMILLRFEDLLPFKNLRGVFAVSDLCEKTIYIEARLLTRCQGYKLFLRLGEPMTLHDRERMERAVRAKHASYDSPEEELAALDDAILGLQSTDAPELCPLANELETRRREVAAKMQHSPQGGPDGSNSSRGEEHHEEAKS